MYLISYYCSFIVAFSLTISVESLNSQSSLSNCLFSCEDTRTDSSSPIHAIIKSDKANRPCELIRPWTHVWTSGTQNNSLESFPPATNFKKDEASSTRSSQTKRVKNVEPLECGEDWDQYDCDDCGGGEWDAESNMLRCKGIPKNDYYLKDCFCYESRGNPRPYEGVDSPSEESPRPRFEDMIEFTEDSYSESPPGWAEKQEKERQLRERNGSTSK